MDEILIGETAAELIDDIQEQFDDSVTVKRVLIVVELINEENKSAPMMRCSNGDINVQLGLLHRTMHLIAEGEE